MTIIILPTYNEAENIRKITCDIFKVFRNENINGSIIIVDDNSPDKTGQIANQLSKEFPGRIHVIHRPYKMGYGSANIQGFKKALDLGANYIFQMDADYSHNPHSIPAILGATKEADLIIGSRYIDKGGIKNWGFYRKITSRGGTFYAKNILDLKINDLTSGYRCYKRKVLETLNLNKIRSEGYSFQIETAYKIKQTGFKIKEIPIIFTNRRKGISKFSKKIFFEAFWIVWKLRLSNHQH